MPLLMEYQFRYIVALDECFAEHEMFAKTAEDADDPCKTLNVIEHEQGRRCVIFQHVFGAMAQEILDDEYTDFERNDDKWEPMVRTVKGLRDVQAVFLQEGEFIMQGRMNQFIQDYDPVPEQHSSFDIPEILEQTNEMQSDSLVYCSTDDVRSVIIYALHEGMRRHMKVLLKEIIANN